jgi:AcrR family transcriptional regulator
VRILDAAMRLMTGGLASLTVPAVSREAGVSVPTIYRHFPTKADILVALYPHAVRRAGLEGVPDHGSFRDIRDSVRAHLDRLDALDDVTRAAMASPIGEEVRHATMRRRYEQIRRLGDPIEPRLATADHDRIARLLVILTQSSSLRTWRDHLGLSADEVADDIEWIIGTAVDAATSGKR